MSEEERDNSDIAGNGCEVQWRLSIIVRLPRIKSSTKQHSRHISVSCDQRRREIHAKITRVIFLAGGNTREINLDWLPSSGLYRRPCHTNVDYTLLR